MERLKQIKANYIIEAIVMIIVGIVLIVWSKASLVVMARAFAVMLFMAGILMVVTYFFLKERNLVMHGGLVMGIIVAVIGVWIFMQPETFTELIPKLFGVFILVSGIMNVVQTIKLARYHYNFWWVALIFALVTIILGGFLLFNPALTNEIIVTVIGIFLIYNGITNLWTITRLTRYAKGVSQAIHDAAAIDGRGEFVNDSAER